MGEEVKVFARIPSRMVRLGGEQHTGWLPEGAAQPLATPVAEVKMQLEITDDGGSNHLLVYESEHGAHHGDTWHQSVEEAMEAAESYFQIPKSEWEIAK